MGWWNR